MTSERDKLAEIISSHTVAWPEACLIADSLLDGGWASPDDLKRSSESSYDEGVDYCIDILERERTVASELRGEDFSDIDVSRIQNTIDSSSGYTYGIYDSHVSEGALSDIISELEDNNHNPFK